MDEARPKNSFVDALSPTKSCAALHLEPGQTAQTGQDSVATIAGTCLSVAPLTVGRLLVRSSVVVRTRRHSSVRPL